MARMRMSHITHTQIVVDNKGTRLSKYKKELLVDIGVTRVTELPFLIDEVHSVLQCVAGCCSVLQCVAECRRGTYLSFNFHMQ